MIARRGDLCAVVTTSRDYVIGQTSTERTSVVLAVVAGVSREGVVKFVRPIWNGTGPTEARNPVRTPMERTYVIASGTIDTDAAIAAYAARRYPTAPHSDMVPPLDSLDALRELLRPFLVESAA